MLLGMIIGSLIIIYLLSSLLNWAIVKRIVSDKTRQVIISVSAASLLAMVIRWAGESSVSLFTAGTVAAIIAAAVVGAIKLAMQRRLAAREVAIFD